MIVIALAAGCAASPVVGAAELLDFETVRGKWRSSDAWLLDRQGEPLQRVRIDPSVRRLDWVTLEQVSPALRAAVVLSEDRRFHEHSGVDWTAVAGAAFRNLFNQRTRGASTLTMQLAGLLDADLRRGAKGRTWSQKIDQAWVALRLERQWRKDQILEAYLNHAPFRGDLMGIDAAAQALFAKQPSGLNLREAAVLAALLRAPNASVEQVARRACGVIAAVEPARAGDCESLDGFVRLAFARRSADVDERAGLAPRLAPHLARAMLRTAGDRVRSTLDASIQRQVVEALRTHLAELEGREVEDGAVLVLDNRSGDVLAWVGSSGSRSSSPEVDGVTAPRQAGSTLKPFLYALAIESRRLTAASILDDSPLDLGTASGVYIPQNYDHRHRGPVSLRVALASSLNVPAVRTLVMVTPDSLHQRMRALGFDTLAQSGDYYGYSLALGSADVSLLALAGAYRVLARGGLNAPIRTRVLESTAPRAGARVFDAATAWLIADILADPNARAPSFGADSVLVTRGWTAVKTGTSKDMRDNWCVGFSDRYTVAAWVGNFSGASMREVSGVDGAAPIWAAVMRSLHRHQPSRGPSPPSGLVSRSVSFDGVPEPPREEWFLAGTELDVVQRVEGGERALALRTPVDRSVFALDPDIPIDRQRIVFEAEGERAAEASWRVDGRVVGRGASLSWLPAPGVHRIELIDIGKVVATARIEVRGLRAGMSPGRPRRGGA